MSSKRIKFDYFKVYANKFNEILNVQEERFCDLTDLLQGLKAVPVKERIYRVGADQARLQEIKENNGKWEIHLIRIRKNNFPVKTHDNGDYTFFDLTDEEGFGEEVSALYDPSTNVIMIRRNISSLSPSSISNYLTEINNTIGMSIFFKPLIHPNSLEKLKESHLIRGFDIAIADINKANDETKQALGEITRDVSSINESVTLNVSIGISPKGSSKKSRLPIFHLLSKFAKDPVVKKAEVRIKDNEDSHVEKFDLIQDKMSNYITFTDKEVEEQLKQFLKEEFKEKLENGEIDEEDLNEMINLKTIQHKVIIKKMHHQFEKRLKEIQEVYR